MGRIGTAVGLALVCVLAGGRDADAACWACFSCGTSCVYCDVVSGPDGGPQCRTKCEGLVCTCWTIGVCSAAPGAGATGAGAAQSGEDHWLGEAPKFQIEDPAKIMTAIEKTSPLVAQFLGAFADSAGAIREGPINSGLVTGPVFKPYAFHGELKVGDQTLLMELFLEHPDVATIRAEIWDFGNAGSAEIGLRNGQTRIERWGR